MYPAKDEIFIVQYEDKKTQLLKAVSAKKDIIEAVDARNIHEEVTVSPDDVVALLGHNPKFGGAYKQTIEYTRREKETKLGNFYYMVDPKKPLVKEITKAANKVHARLDKFGLGLITKTILFCVRYTNSSTMLGSYSKGKKGETDNINLFINPVNDYVHTLSHEVGHAVWDVYLQDSDRIKAKWVSTYKKYLKVESFSGKELRHLRLSLVDGSFSSLTQLRKELRADGSDLQKEAMKYTIAYIRKHYRLSVEDIDALVADGNKEIIKEIWPVKKFELTTEKINPVSNYAMKNVTEFFCEAFALKMTKKKLPKSLDKLLSKTITHAVHNIGKVE